MDAPKSLPKSYYRPELDVVRFLAFSLVFLRHVLSSDPNQRVDAMLKGFAPLLYASVSSFGFGLSLFFTLSAFLICELLLRERKATGTIASRQFYIRRILRIWPLYYLVLAIGVSAAFLPGGEPGSALRIGWFAIFMGGWYFANHGQIPNLVFPLWSISVEEQFYLIAPWVVKFFNRRSLYGLCLILILVANLWLFHLGKIRTDDDAIWYNSFVQFECFASGILLCLVLNGRLPQISGWQRLLLLAGGWFSWFFASYGLHSRFEAASDNPGSWHLIGGYGLASLGSVMLLVAFLGMNPNLLPRWSVYLGRISFGLYVFHAEAIEIAFKFLPHPHPYHGFQFLLKLCIAFGLSVLMATISYRFFETPFLRIKKRHAVIQSQPV